MHIISLFFLELSGLNWLLVPLIIAAQCWLSVGMFIAAHDAMHGSLAPGRPWLNSAIGGFLLAFYAGFGWRRMRDAHWEHHKHPGTDKDPDFDAENPQAFLRWYTTFFTRYFAWPSIAYIATIVSIYWLALGVPVENLVLLYAAPAIGSSFQLFYFGTYRPHRHMGAQDNGPAFADRHNARTDDFSTLASLFSCFHFGYHHEHHLSPQTPWWALPKLHQTGIRHAVKTGRSTQPVQVQNESLRESL